MAEKKQPSLWGLLSSGLKDYSRDLIGLESQRQAPNLLKYINEMDLSDPKVKNILVDYARSVSSDEATAIMGAPWLGTGLLSNILTGNIGEYKGQNLDHLRMEMDGQSADIAYNNEYYKVKDAPNLRDIFFGILSPEDEGLKQSLSMPSQGYPFEEGEVYDVSDYVNIEPAFQDENFVSKVFNIVSQLDKGEGTRIETPNIYTSLDLGAMNWSIGKDDKGNPYLALADIWDFGGGELLGYGELMDQIGSPINLYGRFYLNE